MSRVRRSGGSSAPIWHRGTTWRYVVRALVTLGATAGILYWLLFSLFLAVIRCGDNCGGADAEHWRWTTQFVLAAMGGGLGVVALVLGFTSRARVHRVLLLVSLGCALAWVFWVLGLGGF